ncbi:MAG: FAD-dependent oxidoreductase [Planctomycetes bacterium]|nr:FAD-dependent oxidoreductase [Planctomycetota bacterium]
MEVLVLGAGLAGLAAAFELTKLGHEVRVVESGSEVGGMASSWKVGPFWLDHGPHRFHSRDARLVEHVYEVLDGDVVIRRRQSRIHLRGRYFDYPLKFGNVVQGLPSGLLARAGFDYLVARTKELVRPTEDANFERWVKKRFGDTLYELFFGTYTEKTWGIPCDHISADWAAQRIAQRSLLDTVVKTLRPPKGGAVRSLADEFYYPAHGGIGEFARRYAGKIVDAGGTIELDAPVSSLVVREGRVLGARAADGRELVADHTLCTIPLPRLMSAAESGAPESVRSAADGLDYVAILFVYLEVDTPSVSPDHWIYLPERHLRVHRVSEFKNFSDAAAPGDRTAICCEITCRVGDATWNLDLAGAAQVAELDLVASGLVELGSTRPLDLRRLAHAYPVYEVGYQDRLRPLLSHAKSLDGFTSTGRQGLFRYNNMDHSIAMGRKAARGIHRGRDARAEEVAAGQEYFG